MSVDTCVRPARREDLEVLRLLEREAREHLGEVRGGRERLAERPALNETWTARIEGSGGELFVAEVDGVVFGWLWLEEPDAQGTVRITDVYVDPGARDLGLGDDLVEFALRRAEDQGARRIESWALPGDRDTKNLFERSGLTARLIVVSRALGSSDPGTETH